MMRSSSFSKEKITPSSANLLKLLGQSAFIGLAFLACLFVFHGVSLSRVLWGTSSSHEVSVSDDLLASVESLENIEIELPSDEPVLEVSGPVRVSQLGDLLFSDGDLFLEAKDIVVGDLITPLEYRKYPRHQK